MGLTNLKTYVVKCSDFVPQGTGALRITNKVPLPLWNFYYNHGRNSSEESVCSESRTVDSSMVLSLPGLPPTGHWLPLSWCLQMRRSQTELCMQGPRGRRGKAFWISASKAWWQWEGIGRLWDQKRRGVLSTENLLYLIINWRVHSQRREWHQNWVFEIWPCQ